MKKIEYTNVEEKIRKVCKLVSNGVPIGKACKEARISTKTLYKYMRKNQKYAGMLSEAYKKASEKADANIRKYLEGEKPARRGVEDMEENVELGLFLPKAVKDIKSVAGSATSEVEPVKPSDSEFSNTLRDMAVVGLVFTPVIVFALLDIGWFIWSLMVSRQQPQPTITSKK